MKKGILFLVLIVLIIVVMMIVNNFNDSEKQNELVEKNQVQLNEETDEKLQMEPKDPVDEEPIGIVQTPTE